MRSHILIVGLVTGFLTAAPGCAGWNQLRKAVSQNQAEDVAVERKKRQEEIAKDFDRRRDEAQFQAAVTRWQQNDVEGCHELVEKLLARNPDHRRARLLLADLHVFTGRPSQAIEVLDQLIQSDPRDAFAHHAIAQALDVVGRRSDAMTHYELATQLEPASELYALSYKSAIGGGLTDENRTSTASAVVSATTAQPKQPAGPIVPAGGPNVAPSVSDTQIVPASAAGEPQTPQSPLDRAIKALAAGDTAQAIDAATTGLVAEPSQAASLYRILGAAHYRGGQYEAAQSALVQALSLDKADALSYFLMGSTLSKLGHEEAAAGAFAEAARLDPRFAR